MENLARVVSYQLDARHLVRAAADQERAPRMRHIEWHGSQRSLRLVAAQLKAADPVIALVLALVVAAPGRHGVAADGLTKEGLALHRPILKRSGLEIEVERPPVGAARQHAFGRGRCDLHLPACGGDKA